MTNTRDTPVEALERALPDARPPLRAPPGERWRRRGTRAATASSASSRCSKPVTVSLVTERRLSAPWGLAGGAPGRDGGELAAARRRRVDAPSASPTRCTRRAARRRRAADPHPGRRRLRASLNPDPVDERQSTGRTLDDLDLERAGAGLRSSPCRPARGRAAPARAVTTWRARRASRGAPRSSRRGSSWVVVALHADLDDRAGRDDVAGRALDDDRRLAASARAGGCGPRCGPARSSPRRSRRSP